MNKIPNLHGMTRNGFRTLDRRLPLAQLIASFGLLGGIASGQPAIDVNSPRPLAGTLARIQEITGTAINYEEVAYENEEDLQKTTAATHPGLKPRIIPRGGQLTIPISISGPSRDVNAYAMVQQTLASYAIAKLPGSYRIAQKSDGIEVIPTEIAAAKGGLWTITPVLGRAVTFPYAERPAIETLQLILDSAAKAAAVPIKLLTVPWNGSERVSFSATGQPARDEITNLLAKVGGGPLSYQLLYDPNDGTYYFNLIPVTRPLPQSTEAIPPASPRPSSQNNPFFVKTK